MAQIAIKIVNLPEIRRAFAMSPRLMTKNMNTAIRKAIIGIGRDSRRYTPIDTGRLRASHYERFSSLRGEIGTNTEYDTFVHEGTRFMKARPYLRQSVEKNDQQVQEYFKGAVQETLDQIAKETK